MHAYLFINPDKSSLEDKAKEINPKIRIIHYKLEKIADTRELIRQTNMALSMPSVYILDDFDLASVEAQNAFLKRLEEPAQNLYFFLTASAEARVLPTIISRCEVIRFKKNNQLKNEEKIAKFAEFSIGEKFQTLSKITKREDAVVFLENYIAYLYKRLPETAKSLAAADETLARIKANANPTLQLTRMVINI